MHDVGGFVVHHWDLGSDPTGLEIAPLTGGMNSLAWSVTGSAGRFVLKIAHPDAADAFALGLQCAARLDARGVPAGPALATRDGSRIVTASQGPAALLHWVPGRELDGTTDDEILHGDPAPEAFRLDSVTARCGLIDWAGAVRGPLLYDLASAVMYLGGRRNAGPMLAAYERGGALPRLEIESHLDLFERFRWAVQADYFAWRTWTGYHVGADESGNAKGLADARRGLGA